ASDTRGPTRSTQPSPSTRSADSTFRPAARPYSTKLAFLFNYTATPETYTLSLHDALPISAAGRSAMRRTGSRRRATRIAANAPRSEEHTSELQSLAYLVCRLLLEKKKYIQHKNAEVELAVGERLHINSRVDCS